MQINISDELHARYRAMLKERFHSEDVGAAVEQLIVSELRRMAIPGYETDPLTGCKSRFQLQQDVNQRTRGDGYQDIRPFTNRYLCLDIDDFRSYGDVYGPLAGDEVLVELARQLRQTYPDASVYRIGGDEFVVELGNQAFSALPSIDGITPKYSIVTIRSVRDRKRLHHLNRRILFHLDEGIVEASPEVTELNFEYGVLDRPHSA